VTREPRRSPAQPGLPPRSESRNRTMTSVHADGMSAHPAQPGDLIVACADTDGAAYEVGVVTRTRDGMAEAWRRPDGTVRSARFVPGLRRRWLVPHADIDVERARNAAGERTRPFGSLSEVREAMRPWLRGRDPQMEAGS
jgi:hypothetical protein